MLQVIKSFSKHKKKVQKDLTKHNTLQEDIA